MENILNAPNLAMLISITAAVYAAIKAAAPKTENRFDDKVVDAVEKARAWMLSYAKPVWCVVEQLCESGAIKKSEKYGKYITTLKEAFETSFGEKMPAAVESEAALVAEGISAADKLCKAQSENPTQSRNETL